MKRGINMDDGFIRVAAATPDLRVADVSYNADQILALIRKANQGQVSLVVFPELAVTGCTCADLFLDQTLQKSAAQALSDLIRETRDMDIICVLGLPIQVDHALYNAAAVFQRGHLLGMVSKSQIPGYSSFSETRYFSPGSQALKRLDRIDFDQQSVPFGTDLIFASRLMPDFRFFVEIGEDHFMPLPPSIHAAQAGAAIICVPSASHEIATRAQHRRTLVGSHSERLVCATIYANAGEGESTTDLVFSGHRLIFENGRKLAESALYEAGLITADLDVQRLIARRQRSSPFKSDVDGPVFRTVSFTHRLKSLNLQRFFSPYPFVPADPDERADRCEAILLMQIQGLKKRLQHIQATRAIIGLSGGLDSALAFIVTIRTFDALKLDRKGIIAVTMPGPGTTERTRQNARQLADAMQTTCREISINRSVLAHLEDINHDPKQHDVVYENAQARERTQILMDLANQYGGLVVGTGDLSEMALGWATYNGDHMSMYAVNSSVPKTLVRHLVRHFAVNSPDPEVKRVLLDIIETPISPELLPPKDGQMAQKTEHIVGPYPLHDFFLFYLLRYGFTPQKLLRMASLAFSESYGRDEIRHWLRVFLTRFFSQQFKRSCMPDGPKVGRITLSPRGDWHMPSDAVVSIWIKQLEVES
jgi:NAD+ synthase (glutamine-hydrolysing)